MNDVNKYSLSFCWVSEKVHLPLPPPPATPTTQLSTSKEQGDSGELFSIPTDWGLSNV